MTPSMPEAVTAKTEPDLSFRYSIAPSFMSPGLMARTWSTDHRCGLPDHWRALSSRKPGNMLCLGLVNTCIYNLDFKLIYGLVSHSIIIIIIIIITTYILHTGLLAPAHPLGWPFLGRSCRSFSPRWEVKVQCSR